jgi:hypothetical protein
MRKTQAKPDTAQASEEKNVVNAATGYIETPSAGKCSQPSSRNEERLNNKLFHSIVRNEGRSMKD